MSDDCVTVRARVRRSLRAIDPEFDACRDVFVGFLVVDKKKKKKKKKKQEEEEEDGAVCASGPCLVVTPAVDARLSLLRRVGSGTMVGDVVVGSPTISPTTSLGRRHRSFQVVGRSSVAAVKPRRRPSSHTGAPSSAGPSPGNDDGGAADDSSSSDAEDDLEPSKLETAHPKISGGKWDPSQHQPILPPRHPSPVPMHRISSAGKRGAFFW